MLSARYAKRGIGQRRRRRCVRVRVGAQGGRRGASGLVRSVWKARGCGGVLRVWGVRCVRRVRWAQRATGPCGGRDGGETERGVGRVSSQWEGAYNRGRSQPRITPPRNASCSGLPNAESCGHRRVSPTTSSSRLRSLHRLTRVVDYTSMTHRDTPLNRVNQRAPQRP